MPVNQTNYDHRGERNYGLVVILPNLVANRCVYFDYNHSTESWVIRDFIGGVYLDNVNSALTIARIEADAVHDEFPPWLNAETARPDWTGYMKGRTTAILRLKSVPTGQPNPASGRWLPL